MLIHQVPKIAYRIRFLWKGAIILCRLWSIREDGLLWDSFEFGELLDYAASRRYGVVCEKREQLVGIGVDDTHSRSLHSRFFLGSVLDFHCVITHLRHGKSWLHPLNLRYVLCYRFLKTQGNFFIFTVLVLAFIFFFFEESWPLYSYWLRSTTNITVSSSKQSSPPI